MAKDTVEPHPETLELLALHIGDDEAHAASDVGSGATRNDETMGVYDGADRNTGAFVEVRGQNTATDFRLDIAKKADAVEFPKCIRNSCRIVPLEPTERAAT